jgi:hypothetical protein
MNLAKSPGSTIQILGAEKALFRALKTKHDTPKYGVCISPPSCILPILMLPAYLPRIPYWPGYWKEQGQDRSYARCQVRLGSPRRRPQHLGCLIRGHIQGAYRRGEVPTWS